MAMTGQVTIGKKLAACFGATCALIIVMGISAWLGVTSLQNEIDQSVNSTAKKVEIVSEIKSSVLTFRLAERGILLFSAAKIPGKVQLNIDLFAKTVAGISEEIHELRPLITTGTGRQLTDAVEAGVLEYARIQADIPRLCASGKVQEAMKEDADRLVPLGTATVGAIDKLLARQRDFNAQAVTRTGEVARNSHLVVGVLILLSLGMSGFAALTIVGSTRELRSITSELA